jgi:predicted phosphodiesterase
MKVVFISDTHGKHRRLVLPAGDMIIHAGDVTFEGADHQAEDFLQWFSGLAYKHRIFIAGNHDFYFENLRKKSWQKLFLRELSTYTTAALC